MGKKTRLIAFVVAIAIMVLQAMPIHADQLSDAFDAIDKKDYKHAYELVLPLAEKGNAAAQGLLATMFSNGLGVAKDDLAAVKWWKKAAEQGEPNSEFHPGQTYAARGTQADDAQAVKWWRKAAEQGLAAAETRVGLAYYTAHGVDEDQVEAAKWFARAADKNDPLAQAKLSEMYFLGQGGLSQSVVEAYKWALIAGDAGKQFFVAVPKMTMETAMTATQKKEGIRLAEQWKYTKGLSKSPPAPIPGDDTVFRLLKQRELASKCASSNANDLAWCDAYIAGVVDTLGANRKSLNEDAENFRFCLTENAGSLSQFRQAVIKGMKGFQEEGAGSAANSVIAESSAANSVIAGVLVYFCQ